MSKYDAIYMVLLTIALCLFWLSMKFMSDSVSDYEIIKPTDGIECVVVSRMFNTSVDCWKP